MSQFAAQGLNGDYVQEGAGGKGKERKEETGRGQSPGLGDEVQGGGSVCREMKYRVGEVLGDEVQGEWIRISRSDVFRREGRCTFWRQSTATLARLR